MILRFLRLFVEFLNLEELCDKQFTELEEARRDVFTATMRAELADKDRDAARAELTHALKMITNWQSVQAGAVAMPFPDVHIDLAKPSLDDSANPKQPERMQMRTIQRQAVSRSRREAYERSQLAKAIEDDD